MGKIRIRDRAWYANAVAICIGVILFVFLWQFPQIWNGIKTFIGYFKPVILGCAIAYIVNPLANAFRRLFRKIKKEKTRDLLANAAAFLIVILFLVFSVVMLIPQLAESIRGFIENLNDNMASITAQLESWGISQNVPGLEGLIGSSENVLNTISEFLSENLDGIVSAFAGLGKGLFSWLIALILSIYLIAERSRLKTGFRRLLRAIFKESRYEGISQLLHKCDAIFNRYIVYSLIDAMIIGLVNAIFMTVCGMEYIGLTSFVVAVTNLIPTFGPMIGMVVGGFILLMGNPTHALIFIIFTLVLQTLDGYVIKPRLFGSSLGVSGLWILIGVIVGGNMFGVIGILLAIPCVAVLDFMYGAYLIPALEKRNQEKTCEVNSDEAKNS